MSSRRTVTRNGSCSIPGRSAVVVIDMINEFCKPGGKMVLPGYETLVPQQRAVIEAARAARRAGPLGA